MEQRTVNKLIQLIKLLWTRSSGNIRLMHSTQLFGLKLDGDDHEEHHLEYVSDKIYADTADGRIDLGLPKFS